MAYSFQTFSVGEVLTSSKMNQIEVNVRDHVHGTSSGVSATLGTLLSNLLFTDNTYDIGASGATRPRHIYVAQNIVAGGAITAAGNITAYYSDERLKSRLGNVKDALRKVLSLDGFLYKANDLARSFGYESQELEVGLSAQQVQAVLPEVVCLAPFDDDGKGGSRSGERYLTIRYEKLVPLLVEAIKALAAEVHSGRGLQ